MMDAIGCRNMSCWLCKDNRVMVISMLLLIAVLCTTAGLYHGITEKRYSRLAIVLGIWVPGLLLGMISIYMIITCVQESRKKSAIHPSSYHGNLGDMSLECETQQNARINFGYDSDVDSTSIDDDSTISRTDANYSCEISRVNDGFETRGRRKISRSLSSSDLAVHYHRSPARIGSENLECSPARRDDSQCTSAIISGNSRRKSHREFKRSLSESRTRRNRKDSPNVHVGNTDSPKFYKGNKYYSPDKQELSDYNFYQRQVGESCSPGRTHAHIGNNDNLEFQRGRTFVPAKQSDCEFSRIEQANVQVGNLSNHRFYRKDEYLLPEEPGKTKCQFYNTSVEGLSRSQQSDAQVRNFERFELHKDSKYSKSVEQGLRRCEFDKRSTEGFSKVRQSKLQTGTYSGFTDEIHRESEYPASGDQELSDYRSYNRTICVQPRMTRHSSEYFPKTERDVIEREREYLSPQRFFEENQRTNSYRREALTYSPENKIAAGKYLYRKPEMTRLSSYSVIDNPREHRSVGQSYSPSRNRQDEYLKTTSLDFSSNEETGHAIRSNFEIPDILQKKEKTERKHFYR